MTEEMKDFLKELEKQQSWDTNKVKSMLAKRGMDTNHKPFQTVKDVQVGDIFSSSFTSHPAIVVKIEGANIIAASMSSTESRHNVYTIGNSRFFNGSFITMTLLTTSIEQVKSRYLGTLDSKKDMQNLQRALRRRYKELFARPISLKKELSMDYLDEFDEIP